MYVVYINLLYFLSIFLFTYNKNLLYQKISLWISSSKYTPKTHKIPHKKTFFHWSMPVANARLRS